MAADPTPGERRAVRQQPSPRARPLASARGRVAVTIVDQGVSSLSNFAVTVAIARLDGAGTLGAFALACAVWQIAAALHRALVTDPMTVYGDARDADATAEVQRGLAAELLLGLAGGLVLALVGGSLLLFGQRMYGIAMLVLAPWLPMLVAQDYWRWIGFMSRRPDRALANDVVFNCSQGVAFAAVLVLHVHSIGVIVAAWGVGGLAGALYGLRQHRVRPAFAAGWTLLIERWHLSKWLAGDTVVANVAHQVYIVFVGALLGPVGLGQLQAARTLVVGPSMMLIQAGGSAGLPEASRAFDHTGWKGVKRVSGIVTGLGLLATGACAAIVGVFGGRILTLVYGTSFAHLHLTAALLAIGLVVTSTELGPLMNLKATRNTRFILYMQLVNLVVTLGSVTSLSLAFGITGAAGASVARSSAGAITSRWLERRARRTVPADAEPRPEVGGASDDARLEPSVAPLPR